MSDESGCMWKQAVTSHFKIPFQNFTERARENYEKTWPR